MFCFSDRPKTLLKVRSFRIATNEQNVSEHKNMYLTMTRLDLNNYIIIIIIMMIGYDSDMLCFDRFEMIL